MSDLQRTSHDAAGAPHQAGHATSALRPANRDTAAERAAHFRSLYAEARIDDQIRYYSGRRDEYAKARNQSNVVRNLLFGLSALAGFLTQAVGAGTRPLLGVIAAALAALAGVTVAYESLIGFESLEKIFTDALRGLRRARDEWDNAPAGADLAPMLDSVERIFRSETGQWGQLVKKTGGVEPVGPAEAMGPAEALGR